MEISADIAIGLMTSLAADVVSNEATGTSAAASATTTQNGIESLLSDAQSLINSLYPSTTVTDVASLTWPSTVVIGSKTYTIHPSSTLATSVSSSQSPSSAIASTTQEARPAATSLLSSAVPSSSTGNISSKSHDPWDRRLGIILGVVLGVIALALFAFLVWFLHRRRKQTGTFFKRRPVSPTDDEVLSWRQPGEQPPPMAAHGLYASRSWAHDDDGMHPGYQHTAYEGPAELSAERSERGSLQELEHTPNRPPTPFSPDAFNNLPTSPVSPIDRETQYASPRRSSGVWPPRNEGYYNPNSQLEHSPSIAALAARVGQDYPHPYYQNPFASHEDDDDDDEYDIGNQGIEPPVIPSRSPKRRSSPQVFYPSGDELNQFDFGLERQRGSNAGRWRDV